MKRIHIENIEIQKSSSNIIPFELFINWNLPLILCEGPFDAIAIKRNAIPLLGSNIQGSLMKKIVTSTVKKIYIALDSDAIKKSIKYAEEFINEGKEVYIVELQGKDPSEMGFTISQINPNYHSINTISINGKETTISMSKKNIKKSYNRILEISEDSKQITLPDARYYRRNGKYYPSVTYVLSYYPKGKHFQDWLKKVGYSADWIVKKAGEEGTQVHEMIEDYLNGKELNFLINGVNLCIIPMFGKCF